jgi:hypothetical protein
LHATTMRPTGTARELKMGNRMDRPT